MQLSYGTQIGATAISDKIIVGSSELDVHHCVLCVVPIAPPFPHLDFNILSTLPAKRLLIPQDDALIHLTEEI